MRCADARLLDQSFDAHELACQLLSLHEPHDHSPLSCDAHEPMLRSVSHCATCTQSKDFFETSFSPGGRNQKLASLTLFGEWEGVGSEGARAGERGRAPSAAGAAGARARKGRERDARALALVPRALALNGVEPLAVVIGALALVVLLAVGRVVVALPVAAAPRVAVLVVCGGGEEGRGGYV